MAALAACSGSVSRWEVKLQPGLRALADSISFSSTLSTFFPAGEKSTEPDVCCWTWCPHSEGQLSSTVT